MHSTLVGGAVLNVRTLQRQLAGLLPEARTVDGESTLELTTQGNDAPRLVRATVLEGDRMQAHPVPGAGVVSLSEAKDDGGPCAPGFRAFLDGTQRSQVFYVDRVPVVLGTVAAVVRERRDRRMHTWESPLIRSRLYVSRRFLGEHAWSRISGAYGDALVDTTDGVPDIISHPYALCDAAVQRVKSHREQVERRLAERWCDTESDALFLDGGISGSERVATSALAVGVVKSHRTLYAEGDGLDVVMALEHHERSSVFSVTSSRRTTVASWYLRMRDHRGHDPMWGLVRAEVAQLESSQMAHIGARADEVSRWILAEASPLALPDGRWDKMVYGVRDCEEYLRAIQ